MVTRDWLRTVVPLGVYQGAQWVPRGAGVVMSNGKGMVWLVTAGHVVADNPEVVAVVEGEGGRAGEVTLGVTRGSYGWFINSALDVAVHHFFQARETLTRILTEKDCVSLADTHPGADAYTVGFPYGLPGMDPSRPAALMQDGIVSGVNPHDSSVFTTAATFPKNSGGPLLVRRESGELAFGGIMLGHFTLQHEGGPPPVHLRVARSADALMRSLQNMKINEDNPRIVKPKGPPPSAKKKLN